MGIFNVSYIEACRMTYHEYDVRMLAQQIKDHKQEQICSMQAWFNNVVKAQKEIKNGKKITYKPVFEKYTDFYDSREIFDNILYGEDKKQNNQLTMADINKRLNAKEGEPD
jgi:hypothetical protein